MSRAARWEIVRTDDGWHARFRSSNGNVIVSSETYARKGKALRAVELTTDAAAEHADYSSGHLVDAHHEYRGSWRLVDERRRSDG